MSINVYVMSWFHSRLALRKLLVTSFILDMLVVGGGDGPLAPDRRVWHRQYGGGPRQLAIREVPEFTNEQDRLVGVRSYFGQL